MSPVEAVKSPAGLVTMGSAGTVALAVIGWLTMQGFGGEVKIERENTDARLAVIDQRLATMEDTLMSIESSMRHEQSERDRDLERVWQAIETNKAAISARGVWIAQTEMRVERLEAKP